MTRRAWTRILAALCGSLPLAAAFAQGALKPVDALVVNPPSRPVPVTVLSTPAQPGEGSREIYKLATTLDFVGGNIACSAPQTLPTGKRLVLQHMGGNAGLFGSALVHVSIRSPGGLPELVVPAAAPVSNPSGANFSAAGQHVQAYFDGNFEVCAAASALTGGIASISLRGYLVNLP